MRDATSPTSPTAESPDPGRNPPLEQLFDAGVLLRPSDRRPNLVHLVRALATLAGVGDLGASPPVADIVSTIGPAEHLIFVLMDGLGMNLVRADGRVVQNETWHQAALPLAA